MKKIIKDIKGITLMSLVITIIVLIILAGITLKLVLGSNGLIAKAQYAKTQSEIGSEKEQLSMAVTEATLDNNDQQPTLEQIKNKIVEKGITTADNIKVGTDRLQVTTPKGHTYTIDINGDIEYVGEGAVTVPDLTDATVAFTYTPSTWTNGNVQVGITTTVKGFSLQYSTDGSTWSNYSSQIIASSNETIYARLWDGINYGGVATGNVTNIDKINPTLTLSTTNTSNSITITATGSDNESGVAGYKYSKDNGNTWTDTTTNNTYTYTGLTQGQAYQIIVQVFDKAGNTVSKNATVTTGAVTGLTGANTTFTYTPSTWTNGNVQVGISTTETGNTLQYSTDGSTWNTYTGAITITNNQAIYARLYDGINYGGVATGNVTNIDKTNPTLTLSQDTGIPRTITINAEDTQSGINTIQYNNGGIWQSLSTGNITNGKSSTYQVTANATCTFRAIDNAGNITLQSITITGIVYTISETKGGNIISTSNNIAIKDDNGNIVTVPAGFKIASDSATKQESGIVVEDKDGNQFVWIPVNNISNYARTDFGSSYDLNGYSSYSEIMPSDEQTSINQYHGYYIGRYEAGDKESTANKIMRNCTIITNTVTIKQGQVPYNYVTRDQANTLAIGMKTAENYNAKTKLCSSYAWDTALNFIQNKVSGYATTLSSDAVTQTGQTTPVCNIYDIGGNVWEWTTESFNGDSRWIYCYRGGWLRIP